ncbi:MAG: L,D-transpeptidase family protein [Desulfobacteraceae bacterium]
MPVRLLHIALIIGSLLVLITEAPSVLADVTTEIVRTKVEQLSFSGELNIGDEQIASVSVLPELYERCGFCLLWGNPDNVAGLMQEIAAIGEDGLDSGDYHFKALEDLQIRIEATESPEPEQIADFDLLLSDSLIRLAYHLIFGKVDPENFNPHWNLALEIDDRDPVLFIEEVLTSGNLAKALDDLRPPHAVYRNLKIALAAYRRIRTDGGWEPVPTGITLKFGMADERVSALRRRLSISGDLKDAPTESDMFDEQVEKAVKHFQRRHRLALDGTVGKNTLEALNMPVQARIDQIRINLDRARWVLHAINGNFVLVDIAGFEAYFFRGNNKLWESRVQVGTPYRRTPVFRSNIKYLVFNPTWTVPPGILKKDILPAVKKNPNYLKERSINVIDHQGNIISREAVDWSQYPQKRFPYMLRQEPGPGNALGLIKIMFPNKHLVYLHDTPSKSLFEREERTFSSGCIRVERPFELAELLLGNPVKWNQESIQTLIASQKTATINLPEHIPVLLLYWTVAVEQDGTVHFKKDPYNRDNQVLEGLKEPFKFRKRPFGKQRPAL